jgi:biopolymer transport protein ExbB
MMKSRFFLFVFLLATGLPQLAHAWWNEAWTGRRTIVIDTSTTGVEIAAPVASAVLPVRLHSGNYDFLAGQPGGADIRVLAGDDKTPLKVGVEHFDPASELGVLWVQVPQIAPKTAGQKLYLYFGNAGVQAEVAAPLFDGATAAVFQFRSEDERPQDVSGKGNHAQAPLAVEKAGLLGASGRFEGASLRLPAASTLALTAGAGFTFSTWVKPAATGPRALLYRQGPLSVVIAGGMLTVEGTSGSPIRGGTLATDTWQHVAVTVGAGETALFINGMRVAAGPGNLPAVQGEVVIGDGLIGLLDEVQLASTRRPAEWIKLAAAAGGADGLLLKLVEDGAQ